jgi:hypothetical protein
MSTNVIRDESRWIKPHEQDYPEDFREYMAGVRWVEDRTVRRESRQLRLDLREVSGWVSPRGRVARCGSTIEWQRNTAKVKVKHEDGCWHAGVEGLMSCDRPHECPVCSARIGAVKGSELANNARVWLEAGYVLAFVTMDVARVPGESLPDAMKALKAVKARFNRISNGRLEAFGSEGNVESTETTIDRSWNGSGHPHYMRLLFLTSRDALGEIQREFGPLWARAAEHCGRYADPVHGFHVAYPEVSEDGSLKALGAYFTKTGSSMEREMLSHGSKASRSEGTCAPFELLEEIKRSGDFSTSNPMVQTWHLYCEAMRQVPVAIYSRFLKRKLHVLARTGQLELDYDAVPDEPADEEIAQALAEEAVSEEIVGDTAVELGRQAVKFIHRKRLWGRLYTVVEDLAEWGHFNETQPDYVAAVRALLEGFGAPEEALAEIWREGEVS